MHALVVENKTKKNNDNNNIPHTMCVCCTYRQFTNAMKMWSHISGESDYIPNV